MIVRPEFLFETFAVVTDYFIRELEYLSGRTIILFELVSFTRLEVLAEIENVFEIRAAPAVNALIFVADNEHVTILRRENFHDVVLDAVSVLKLVYMNIAEFVLIVFARFVVRSEKLVRLYKKIVVVERVVFF